LLLAARLGGRLGCTTGRAAPPGPRRSGGLISLVVCRRQHRGRCGRHDPAGADGAGFGFAKTLFGFEFGLALLLLLSWRSSSALRGLSAASRSACRCLPCCCVRLAPLPQSAFFGVADSGVGEARCTQRFVVSVNRLRSTTPEPLRGAAGRCGRGRWALGRAGLATTGSGAWFRRGAVGRDRRLPRFSTTTCLVRPWLKLWPRCPSRRALERQGLGRTLSSCHRSFVSTIQQSNLLSRACPPVCIGELLAAWRLSFVIRHPVSDQDMATRQNVLLAGPASSAACITFDRPSAKSIVRGQRRHNRKLMRFIVKFCGILPDDRVQFPNPSAARRKHGFRGPDRGVNRALGRPYPNSWPAPASGVLDLGKAGDSLTGLAAIASASIALRTSRLRCRRQARCQRGRRVEAFANWLRRMVPNHSMRRRKPQAAAGKLALSRITRFGDTQSDQLSIRPYLPVTARIRIVRTCRSGPLNRGRPKRACCDIAP